MPSGQLKINNLDAYDNFGISFEDKAISALRTPAPMKEYPKASNRKKHGTSILTNDARFDEREISIQFHLSAPSKAEFYRRYGLFCDELAKGTIEIWTSFYPDILYRLVYLSCTQYTEYNQEMAIFTLKVVEPDPTDRELNTP